MEQMTPAEWARDQLRRTPYFATVTALLAVFLFISTLIEYSAARPKPDYQILAGAIEREEVPLAKEIDNISPKFSPEKFPFEAKAPDPPEGDVTQEGTGEVVLSPLPPDLEWRGEDQQDAKPYPGLEQIDLPNKPVPIGYGETVPLPSGPPGPLTRPKTPKEREPRIPGPDRLPTLSALEAGLRWLQSVQEPDGSWDAIKWGASATDRSGATALALRAFLGYGCTDRDPKFGATVRKAVDYLTRRQDEGGGFRERMYEQGLCTLALAEAYAMGMRRPSVKEAAQKGLDYIARLQSPTGGFGYMGPGDDVSVTGFQLQAMKAAIVAGLNVPDEMRQRTEQFLRDCLNKDYSTGYHVGNPGQHSTTAASLTGRLLLGHSAGAPDSVGQARWLSAGDEHLAIAREAQRYYSIYYLSLSMYQMGGPYWNNWNKVFNQALRERQEKTGPTAGSWPPAPADYGAHGGRIYTTAMACMSLEVYWLYERASK